MADPGDLRDAGSPTEAIEWDANGPRVRSSSTGAVQVDTGLLEQDAIESALGVSRSGDPRRSGLQALVDNNTVSYERLLMLEVVFDRLVGS
jgi:hypothetical protein